jgi:hypothetical protein
VNTARKLKQRPNADLCLLFVIGDFDVALPGVRAGADGDHQIAGARRLRLPTQLHADFVGQLVALAMVAGIAGAGGVRPVISATTRPRQDVVYREIVLGQHLALEHSAGLHTAVNTGEVIPYQHALATPVRLPARYVDIGTQRNDRRYREFVADRLEEISRLFNNDGLACQNQIDRARNGNDRQRLPIAPIEQQDTAS